MKKLFTFLASAALLGAMTACSSDEPAKGQPDVDQPTGDAAYLSVKIIGVDGGVSRSTTDGGFQYGDDYETLHIYEQKVKNAKFFFYNEDGTYAELQASLFNDPQFEDGKAQGEDDNIELIGKDNIIVINGLEKGEAYKYPTYMLTVLNVPEGFTPGATLSEALAYNNANWCNEEKVTGSDNNEYVDKYFVMSTTSYLKGSETDNHHDDTNYFVTKLDKSEFSTSLEAAKKADPVDIYVERLASKVEIEVSSSLSPAYTISNNTYTYTPQEGTARTYPSYKIYKLQQTVGGGTNPGESTDGSTVVTGEDLYIHILDWDLGATNPTSYMSKNIAALTDWTDFATSNWGIDSWNDATHFRSYWAKSTLYNAAIGDNTLEYAISNKLIDVDNAAYCNEYTNKPAKIFVNNNQATTVVNPAYTTHATIHARVCDKEGNSMNLIMANGLLYKQETYTKKLLSLYTTNNKYGSFKLYTLDGTTYNGIDESYFTYVVNTDNKGVGHALLQFNDAKKEGTTFYTDNESAGEGDSQYKKIEGDDLNTLISTINSNLKAVQTAFLGTVSATIYDGGHFVYYVPIEHFGATSTQNTAVEGYYGVVRNHWYKLSISEFSKVGHGIWNPENNTETLKPDGPQEYYYLGARINILSWKVVNQSVHL